MTFDRNRKVLAGGLGAASVAWMGLIFYLSSLTGPEASLGLDSTGGAWLGDELRSYAVHALLFGVLAALIQSTIWGWNRRTRVRWVIAVVVFVSLYGVSDEYHQSFVAGRSATLADVMVDSVSAVVTVILVWSLAARNARRKIGRP